MRSILSLALLPLYCAASSIPDGFRYITNKGELSDLSPYPQSNDTAVNPNSSIQGNYDIEHVQLFYRHGTRYPIGTEYEVINQLLDDLRIIRSKGRSESSTLAWTDTYAGICTPDQVEQLAAAGFNELYLHGQDVADKYPHLVDALMAEDSNTQRSMIYASTVPRVIDSMRTFGRGLYDGRLDRVNGQEQQQQQYTFAYTPVNQTAEPYLLAMAPDSSVYADEHLLQAYLQCVDRFGSSIKQQIGLRTAKQISGLYRGCAYDMSVRGRADTFCSLLSKNTMARLGYCLDLQLYNWQSYGSPYAQRACRLMQNVIGALAPISVQGATTPRPGMVLRFGHDEMLAGIATFLGLFKDPFQLTPNLDIEKIKRRQFRMADIAPFGGSIAIELISKQGMDKYGAQDRKHYVRVLFSGNAVVIPGCDEAMCPLKTFLDAVTPLLQCKDDLYSTSQK